MERGTKKESECSVNTVLRQATHCVVAGMHMYRLTTHKISTSEPQAKAYIMHMYGRTYAHTL